MAVCLTSIRERRDQAGSWENLDPSRSHHTSEIRTQDVNPYRSSDGLRGVPRAIYLIDEDIKNYQATLPIL